jgi:TonB-linked SusC/RagA family outer membrane protein
MKKKLTYRSFLSARLKHNRMPNPVIVILITTSFSFQGTFVYPQNINLDLNAEHRRFEKIGQNHMQETNISVISESSLLQQMVRGRVIDALTRESLPGVNILVKGTTTGTTTNVEGDYSLQVPGPDAVLVFTFVGYLPQQVTVGNQGVINVNLSQDVVELEDVVVIGYGTQKKSDLTGAVTHVDAERFKTLPISQVSEMLAGTVAGFYANQGTTAAGGASLEIRGPTSLTGGTDPLIVLDGVIYHGSLQDINPNDIASIDILKDASSAAVFGSKAASGVILITTTKGATGKPVINFNTKIGVNSVTNKSFRPHDAQGYQDYRRALFRTSHIPNTTDYYWNHPDDLPEGVTVDEWYNLSSNPHPDITQEYLGRLNFFPVEKEVYLSGETVDWFSQVYQPGIRQDYDISIRGGSERFKYYYSLGYVDNEGVHRGDEFQAVRSRLNIDFEITDWLTVGTNAQFARRDDSTVPTSTSIQALSPYSKIFEDDGSLKWHPNDYSIIDNPLINHFHQERLNKTTSIFASMYTNVDLPFGIQYRLSFQPRFEFRKDYNFWGDETITGKEDHVNGYGTREEYAVNAWLIDNILSWKKEIGIHRFDVTLLYNAEQTKTFNTELTNEDFLPTQGLIYHGMQFGAKPDMETNDTEAGGNALMARLNYTLLDKYLITASIRRDGYSAFGRENNKATFPAAAVGWIISEEEFFGSELISNLKLRLSWGINGNRDIGIYSALAQVRSNLYYDGTNVQMGIYNNTLANNNLRWEKTEAYNIGLDIALFNNRIDLSAEFYDMTTTDLLMDRQLPEITGFSSVTSNLGELQNRGMDLTLNTVNISQSNVTWKSGFVFSMNRNKIIELFGDTEEVEINGEIVTRKVPDYSNEWFPGEAIDVVWDYELAGIWQLDEEALAAEYGMLPGDYKAVDVDGDKNYDALVDKQFIGHTRPRYRLGLRNDVSFLKNFTASVFVRADLGHIMRFPEATHEFSTYDRRNYWNIPYWTPTNGENEYPRLNEVRGQYGGGLRVFKPGSFVRIQDISLSYNFPDNLSKRIGVSHLSFFVSARNAFTFTKWPGWDPESRDRARPTRDRAMPKTYTMGLNVSI